MTAEQDGPECLSDRESGREGRVRAGERFKETESNSQSTWLGGGARRRGARGRVPSAGGRRTAGRAQVGDRGPHRAGGHCAAHSAVRWMQGRQLESRLVAAAGAPASP